jgi:hypothetical protein
MYEELTWMTPGSASVLMSPRSVSSLAIFFRTRRIIFPDLEIRIINAILQAVLGIRIRMFLGLPDPDQLVRGMDPDLVMDPDPFLFS